MPVLAAIVVAATYLLVAPWSADLAAHTFRAELFGREGWGLWNGQWYGGHHLPGYSLLFPPLAWALGPRLAGALGAVAAAALFAALVRGRWGREAWLGAVWFGALGSASLLATGRLAFGLGLAVGLSSLLALQRGRRRLGLLGAVATALASPVAALFLALAGGALALAGSARGGTGAALTVAALGPVVLLALLFPEGGTEPFLASAFWPVLAFAALATVLLPRRERTLRAGVVLYGVAALALFLVGNPVGGNVARLGALLAGPVAAAALAHSRPRLLAALAVPLLFWQLTAPVRDVGKALHDPSVHAGYYAGLLAFLRAQGGPPARLEIPFTLNHWEAARVAPAVPLARGWERQLERRFNGVLSGPPTAVTYRRWLDALAVRWVALPDVALDHTAQGEARLIGSGLPYLRPAWHDAHWRVWAVRRAAPLARGPARVTAYAPDALLLRVRAPGRVVVQVRWTPYWALAEGSGCVAEAPGGWTALALRRRGRARLVTSFSLARVRATGPRCR